MPAATPTRKTKAAKGSEPPVPARRSRKSSAADDRQFPLRRMRHRVMCSGKYVFGPGKADVLSAIGETGSLAAAARRLGMSYMRAWLLVQEMQRTFASPLVVLQRGGKAQGGASLTEAGQKALALYHQMEAEALAATEPAWKIFCQMLRGG